MSNTQTGHQNPQQQGFIVGCLRCFDIPVSDIIPDSVIHRVDRLRKTVLGQLHPYRVGCLGQLANNPMISRAVWADWLFGSGLVDL